MGFGLAKLIRPEEESELTLTSPVTMPGMVMGTIGYMSPEQVRGESPLLLSQEDFNAGNATSLLSRIWGAALPLALYGQSSQTEALASGVLGLHG